LNSEPARRQALFSMWGLLARHNGRALPLFGFRAFAHFGDFTLIDGT